ncbi:MAG: phosphoribosylanthranilate isomerase [Acidobacteriota bacterium]
MVRVKICGNRSSEDVRLAVEAGADAVGFIVGIRYRTEDSLEPSVAQDYVKHTPLFVNTVLVTHLIKADEILALQATVSASIIQLHDEVDSREIQIIRKERPTIPLIKAIPVVNEATIELARAYAPYVDALLLDSRTADRIGGTGVIHDWTISRRIVAAVSKPVILAGGLTPSNVREAITTVQPYGVDVNSGVENIEGNKESTKLREFIRLAKALS